MASDSYGDIHEQTCGAMFLQLLSSLSGWSQMEGTNAGDNLLATPCLQQSKNGGSENEIL